MERYCAWDFYLVFGSCGCVGHRECVRCRRFSVHENGCYVRPPIRATCAREHVTSLTPQACARLVIPWGLHISNEVSLNAGGEFPLLAR